MMNPPTPEQRQPLTATYETEAEAPKAPPESPPPQRPNITAMPLPVRQPEGAKWLIYGIGILLVSSAFMLLFGLLNISEPDERSRQRGRRRASWSDGLLDGDDDEDDYFRDFGYTEEDDRPRRSRTRRRESSPLTGQPAPQAAAPAMPSMPNFVPPIIINTPGQAPAFFGGKSQAE